MAFETCNAQNPTLTADKVASGASKKLFVQAHSRKTC